MKSLTPYRTNAARASPIATGAEPLRSVRCSSVTAKTINKSTKVSRNSIPNPCRGVKLEPRVVYPNPSS